MYEILLALLPFVLLLFLIIILKMPAIKAMPITFLITLVISYFFWKVISLVIAATALKALFVAFEILLIVLGAILLLEVLKDTHMLPVIDSLFKQLSEDKRVYAIIIAWSFGVFIEGAAGFGTPAALAAPLMVGLGIPAIASVIVALISNAVAVSFGAIGTPILIGLGTTITDQSLQNLRHISIYIALVHSIIGLFMPLLVSCVISRFMHNSFKKGLELWKFALFSGASFVVPYLLIAIFIGPEFPSFLGGIIGLIITIYAAKQQWFLPKIKIRKIKIERKKAFFAIFPYLLAALLLFLTRIREINPVLKKLAINLNNIFGSGVSNSFYPLLSPGIIFLLVAIISLLIFHATKKETKRAVKITLKKGLYTFIVLFFAVALVQLLIYSGKNFSGLESMPVVLAKAAAAMSGQLFILISPLIGVFGAFIAGSNTVSNMLFASFQEHTAILLGMPIFLILALQTVGGAAGNMIAIHNVVAATSVVNLKGQEGKIIRFNLLPCILYAILAGIIIFLIKILFF